MKEAWRAALILSTLLLPFVLLLGAGAAWAQAAPQMQVQTSASTVGVGDTVYVELSATSADTMPTDPQLGPAPGLVVRGQNSSPSQTHISINGSRMDRYTLTVTWTLEARRTGSFRIGPPSVVVGGVRHPSQPVTLIVVAAGKAPPRPPAQSQVSPGMQLPPGMPNPFVFSPFDPWKGFMQGFDSQGRTPPAELPAPADPKLSLDAPRGSAYFLHATVDKSAAVVGEQVTFSVYEYIDTGAGRVEVDDEGVHDSAAADFVKRPLLREDQDAPLAGYASIGGRTWMVKLVRRWALFPLRAGDLTIDPMRVTMLRPADAAGSVRTSETLLVKVSEPPLLGRPPGFVPGDVGRFSLTAEVKPREIEEGGAVGVHVEVSGTGNLPNAIAPPARESVEWLTPEVHEELGPAGHDAFGGKRTFDFVVRLRRSGPVDLGWLSLPFWNADQKKYEVARSQLGVVHVSRSASAATASADAVQMLPGLPAPREVLEGSRPPHAHADDSPVFWIAGIGAWPLGFGLAVSGRAAARRVSQAWRRRRTSPVTELRQRLVAATSACDKADARTADAAIARALEAATVAHVGVNVRGAVGGEVAERLERAGIASDTASRVAGLLRECEAARFAPEMADIVAARERWLRAQGAIRGLEKRE